MTRELPGELPQPVNWNEPRPTGSSKWHLGQPSKSEKRKARFVFALLLLLGFSLVATEGTADILSRNGIQVALAAKYSETQGNGERNIVDLINDGEIDIIVNTPSGGAARADGYEIRAAAVAADKALFTTMAVLGAAVSGMDAANEGFSVRSLQEYELDRQAAE